jgi:flagellar hook protein FlgE
MANALQTGVAGLNTHNQLLNVVGNNIANVNTVAYKGRRVTFSDLFYQTLRSSSGTTTGGMGGVNPSQIGSGSRVSQIALNTSQGNFEATGDPLSVAIDGQGFFVVQSPSGPLYTRAGAFGVDESGYLVDPATGYLVQRFGSVGEETGTGIAFQTTGDNSIRIPFGAVIPGRATTQVQIKGNLPSTATGPVAQTLRSTDPFTASGSPADASTLLNDLDINLVDYVSGDTLSITGTDSNGAPVLVSLSVDGTTTLGDLVNAINGAFSGATASLDSAGRLILQSNDTGPSFLSLSLRDGLGNTGGSNLSGARMIVTAVGKDADVIRGTVQVFDGRGTPYNLQLTFEAQSDGSWDLTATLPASAGTIIDGEVRGIRFNDDGSFGLVTGTGLGGPTMTIQFSGQSLPQELLLSFGSPGLFDGLTSVSSEALLTGSQDGFGAGSLTTVRIDSDGTILGIATNGVAMPLAQLAVASFQNEAGLESRGQNYFAESRNSGSVVLGTASAGGRGSIRSGELEQSNVDLAYEFTRLIVAQRGFSANARTITVADAILRELTSLIQ